MNRNSDLELLAPRAVWRHFFALCAIPHPSRHEQALKAHLISWAAARGLAADEDAAGNLILRKAASPGCETAPGVVLQAHLDMVCQANAGTVHDFLRDAIQPVLRDGWVVAEHTTLGADNGIGVALALAVLEADDIVHPALEVLFTVNEEAGMDGARGLAPGTLQGTRLINLDSEEWGRFYVGCAGGVDVVVGHTAETEAVAPGFGVLRLAVGGLQGGHSGLDIHLGRGNAIKLLAEVLRDLAAQVPLQLLEFTGGSARNAIPREAHALCAVPAAAVPGMAQWVAQRLSAWRRRFAGQDAGVCLHCEEVQGYAGLAVAGVARDRLLAFLDVLPNGVDRVSSDFPGVTDTSSNLGVAMLAQGAFSAICKVRSLSDARAAALAARLVNYAVGYGLAAQTTGAYPAWTPDPQSTLLALCQQVYWARFGGRAEVQVIHAGLECGLFAASHPRLEMISFGPDIRHAHAPGERVEVASVARCWELLRALLPALAGKAA